MSGGKIRENKSIGSSGTGEDGGGVYLAPRNAEALSPAVFNMTNGSIAANDAKNGGGVFVGKWAEFTMDNGTIGSSLSGTGSVSGDGNSAYHGGGVYIADEGSVTMSNGGIFNNDATNGGGVFVVTTSSRFVMNNGRIANNTATNHGGGVHGWFIKQGGIIYGTSSDALSGVYANSATEGATYYFHDLKKSNTILAIPDVIN
jgi:hypothetical protein